MSRRNLLIVMFLTLLPILAAHLAESQDVEYIRALERAQEERPKTLAPTARIAPQSEPGTPLVIHGRLFDQDGTSPLAGAIVFAYHTDREGHYHRRGEPAHTWRLSGWARTGADGRFELPHHPSGFLSRGQHAGARPLRGVHRPRTLPRRRAPLRGRPAGHRRRARSLPARRKLRRGAARPASSGCSARGFQSAAGAAEPVLKAGCEGSG